MSHPLRVRGLKPASSHGFMQDYQVASFTGAWIETMNKYTCIEKKYVASFTGAWIETFAKHEYCHQLYCRILYGCVD